MPDRMENQPDAGAREHYLRGNRFFRSRAWDRALVEWRRATQLRLPASRPARALGRRFAQLRVLLLFLVTVLLMYHLIYTVFPRDSMDLLALQSERDSLSWWERWLETGRPAPLMPGKLGIRDWWNRFSELFLAEEPPRRTISPQRGGIPERWAELMRRYGRMGPQGTGELDFRLIGGSGLSRMGAFDEAVTVLEQGIGHTRDSPRLGELYQALANAYYYSGYHLQPDGLARYDLDKVRRAATAYTRSVELTPRPMSFGNLGWMYYLMEDYERAEVFSMQALRMNPGLEYVRLNLGLIHLVQNRAYESFSQYRAVITRRPEVEVYLGGINDLRELLRDRPGRLPFAHLMIGLLGAAQGDYSRAGRHLNRFLASPAPGSSWKALARQVLDSMDTKILER